MPLPRSPENETIFVPKSLPVQIGRHKGNSSAFWIVTGIRTGVTLSYIRGILFHRFMASVIQISQIISGQDESIPPSDHFLFDHQFPGEARS
jgi:hypothetical protein